MFLFCQNTHNGKQAAKMTSPGNVYTNVPYYEDAFSAKTGLGPTYVLKDDLPDKHVVGTGQEYSLVHSDWFTHDTQTWHVVFRQAPRIGAPLMAYPVPPPPLRMILYA